MTVLINPYAFGTTGGGGGISGPDAVSGLVLWLDARDIAGKSDGDTLVAADWPDSSTAGNDPTGVTGTPTYETSVTPTGQPAVNFVRSSSESFDLPDNLFNIQSGTTFVLFRTPTSYDSGLDTWVWFGRTAGGQDRWYCYLNDGDIVAFTGSTSSTLVANYALNTWYIVTLRGDGNNKEGWINGVSASTWTDTRTGDGFESYLAGGNDDFDGDVPLFLHYNVALSDSDVSDVVDWIDGTFLT